MARVMVVDSEKRSNLVEAETVRLLAEMDGISFSERGVLTERFLSGFLAEGFTLTPEDEKILSLFVDGKLCSQTGAASQLLD
jgi:hypothetical protein